MADQPLSGVTAVSVRERVTRAGLFTDRELMQAFEPKQPGEEILKGWAAAFLASVSIC